MLSDYGINIDSIVDIARCAGDEIIRIYNLDNYTQEQKSDHSPLTQADICSHNLICDRLSIETPAIPILSEESTQIEYQDRKNWDTFWLVDPLDGTKEFINRNGEFTVNIALISKGIPVFGVVHAPIFDQTWIGESGKNSIKITSGIVEEIKVNNHEISQPWKVVGSRSHAADSLKLFLEALGSYELISMGSSIKLCLVAEGVADIYPRLGPTSEWDTAAAHAVVNSAGGKVVSIDTERPLRYNKRVLRNPHFIVKSIKEINQCM